jgi:hypothetical protein
MVFVLGSRRIFFGWCFMFLGFLFFGFVFSYAVCSFSFILFVFFDVECEHVVFVSFYSCVTLLLLSAIFSVLL